MALAARKLTVRDFEKFPDDGNRHELLDGEWLVTPSPTPSHQFVSGRLHLRLAGHVLRQKLGVVLYAPVDCVLSEHDVVAPDLLFISNERMNRIAEKNIQGAPDLAVEILSPSTAHLDRSRKLDLYAKSGVLEYWIVDGLQRSIEVREFGEFRRTRVLAEGQILESTLLPGLALPLAELF